MTKLCLATSFLACWAAGSPLAAQSSCSDPDVTVTVSPAVAVPGAPFVVELRNDSDTEIFLPTSCTLGPVYAGSGCSGTPVFAPNCATIIVEIPPGASRTGAWLQNDNLGQQVPAGSYSLQFVYFRAGDTSLRSCCLDVTIQDCDTPARAVTRNGSGVNPSTLNATLPVLGATWSATVDCSGHAPAVAGIFLFGQATNGPVIGVGELLVGGPRYARRLAPHAGAPVPFDLEVPGDLSLCGLTAHAQALCSGAPGAQLSNAIDLILGG